MRLSAHSLRLQPLWTRTDKPVIGDTNPGHAGEQLWRLIDALRADRGCAFTAGPAEALAAHELIIRLPHVGDGLAAYRDHLAPVFAKTVEHRSAFFRVFDALVAQPVESPLSPRPLPLPPTPPLPPPTRWERLRFILGNVLGSWPGRSAVVAVMLVIAASLLMVSQYGSAPNAPVKTEQPLPSVAGAVSAPEPKVATGKTQEQASNSPVARLQKAASLHSGAPTLREIARELSPSAPVRMTTEEYLRRLRDLTGLQLDRPLLLERVINADQLSQILTLGLATNMANDVESWRGPSVGGSLAWAIDQIERPGQGETYDEIEMALPTTESGILLQFLIVAVSKAEIAHDASLEVALSAGRQSPNWMDDGADAADAAANSTVSESDATAPTDAQKMVAGSKRLTSLVKAVITAKNRGQSFVGETVDPPDAVLARALAISHPDWRPSDAPWVPEPERVSTTPNWVAFLVALLTLALFIPALIAMIDRRRAFLRRKPPLTAPHRTQLIRNLVVEPLGAASDFAEARKNLQRREPVLTRALDVVGTITATIRAGGAQIVPRFAAMRSAPEYLVLIDRRNVNDLEAERAATLLDPLRTGAIGFDLFWFHTDPGWCTPEGEGPAVRIEELVARFPNHRLLLMGTGVEMIDLFAGGTRGGYAKLDHWHRRGMLTPVAREDWAREEWLIADAFKAPVGRATSGGLMTLAQHLLDEGKGKGVQLFSEGDDAAPAMPSSLLDNPIQFMGPKPPRFDSEDGEEDPLDDLLIELDYYPDRSGSEWLCALAVYPSVSFDLALYLGQALRERAGDDTSPILLTPRRLAALTQLPWLREGNLPDWLRRRLIERLTPARAGEVRALILGLIATARGPDAEAASNRAMFGRERPAGTPAERLYDDEVLVDFLLEGKPEDFEVDVATAAEPLGWRERLVQADWLKLGTIALALAYGFAAWRVTPRASDGPAGMSMVLPVIALIGAALTCAVMLRPMMVWNRTRALLHRLGPWGLVLALLAIAALLLPLVERGTGTMLLPQGWGWRVALIALAVAMLPLSEWLSGWSFAPNAVRQRRSAGTLVVAALSLSVAWTLVIGARADDAYGVYWLTVLIVAGGALFWRGRRSAPLPLVSTEELKHQRSHTPLRRAAPLFAGLVLLVPVLIHVRSLRQDRTELLAASGYMPVIATSPDGLIAVSQPDGRSVKVFDAATPGVVLQTFQLPNESMTIDAEIIRLAVTRTRSAGFPGALLLAVLSSGEVVAFRDSRTSFSINTPNSIPSSIRIALSSGGGVAVSHVTTNGTTAFTARLNDFASREPTTSEDPFVVDTPRIVAIEPISEIDFAVSVADGRIGVFDGASARLNGPSDRRDLLTMNKAPDLVSGVRLIRALPKDAQGRLHFLVVADDGTAVEGVFRPRRMLTLLPKGVMKGLRMGPVVPWVARVVVPVPPPPPSQGESTQKIVAGNCKGKDCKSPPPLPPPPPVVDCENRPRLPECRGLLESDEPKPPSARTCPNQPCYENPTESQLYQEQFGWQRSDAEASRFVNFLKGIRENRFSGALTNPEIAYLLATVRHETAFTYQPTEERGSETYLKERYFKDQNIRRALGNTTDQDAVDFRGRGYIMVTGRRNYEIVGKAIGVDLIAKPDVLMQPDIALKVLLTCFVIERCFTGKLMSDYLSRDPPDYVNARRVFNGVDQAPKIADYAKRFEAILREIDVQNQRQGK